MLFDGLPIRKKIFTISQDKRMFILILSNEISKISLNSTFTHFSPSMNFPGYESHTTTLYKHFKFSNLFPLLLQTCLKRILFKPTHIIHDIEESDSNQGLGM